MHLIFILNENNGKCIIEFRIDGIIKLMNYSQVLKQVLIARVNSIKYECSTKKNTSRS